MQGKYHCYSSVRDFASLQPWARGREVVVDDEPPEGAVLRAGALLGQRGAADLDRRVLPGHAGVLQGHHHGVRQLQPGQGARAEPRKVHDDNASAHRGKAIVAPDWDCLISYENPPVWTTEKSEAGE